MCYQLFILAGHNNIVQMLIFHSKTLNINLDAKNSLGQSAFNLAFVKKRKRVLELFMATPGFAWKKSSNGEHVAGAIDVSSTKNSQYVGRVHHEGDMLPGTIQCSSGEIHVHGGRCISFLFLICVFEKSSISRSYI